MVVGATWVWGDVDSQEHAPRPAPCVSRHNIIFHNTLWCAALWLLSHNDIFTRCEPVLGRGGFGNLGKQTLRGEHMKK